MGYKNLEQQWDQAIALVGNRQALLWRLSLIGSALAFENNDTGAYQGRLRSQAGRHWNLPLTREGWLC